MMTVKADALRGAPGPDARAHAGAPPAPLLGARLLSRAPLQGCGLTATACDSSGCFKRDATKWQLSPVPSERTTNRSGHLGAKPVPAPSAPGTAFAYILLTR